MIYAITGAVLFGFAGYALCKAFGVSSGAHFGPSQQGIIVTLSALMGFGAGFGYGAARILNGTHPYNHLLK